LLPTSASRQSGGQLVGLRVTHDVQVPRRARARERDRQRGDLAEHDPQQPCLLVEPRVVPDELDGLLAARASSPGPTPSAFNASVSGSVPLATPLA
jgi:hypothetical protein